MKEVTKEQVKRLAKTAMAYEKAKAELEGYGFYDYVTVCIGETLEAAAAAVDEDITVQPHGCYDEYKYFFMYKGVQFFDLRQKDWEEQQRGDYLHDLYNDR